MIYKVFTVIVAAMAVIQALLWACVGSPFSRARNAQSEAGTAGFGAASLIFSKAGAGVFASAKKWINTGGHLIDKKSLAVLTVWVGLSAAGATIAVSAKGETSELSATDFYESAFIARTIVPYIPPVEGEVKAKQLYAASSTQTTVRGINYFNHKLAATTGARHGVNNQVYALNSVNRTRFRC